MNETQLSPRPWTTREPLGEALHFLHMNGVFYGRSELTAPWALEMPAFANCLSFHTVTEGGCLIEVDDAAPLFVRPGDFVLVPHGRGHFMRSEPGVGGAERVDLVPQTFISEHYSVMRRGGGGAETTLLCGIVMFDHPVGQRLMDLLPPVIAIGGGDASEWMSRTLGLIAAEARHIRPGGEAVITRLADVLVIQAVRWWLESDPNARKGWLGALQHEQIGKAIALIHRRPEEQWTVESLAREVAMSRSAFAARFTEVVGEPVMGYVTNWRMQVALTHLRDGMAVGEAASRLGYESEAAFSRAFKRVIGASPGSVARLSRGVASGGSARSGAALPTPKPGRSPAA